MCLYIEGDITGIMFCCQTDKPITGWGAYNRHFTVYPRYRVMKRKGFTLTDGRQFTRSVKLTVSSHKGSFSEVVTVYCFILGSCVYTCIDYNFRERICVNKGFFVQFFIVILDFILK